MTGAKAGPGVSVKILVKRNVVSPVRVGLKIAVLSPDGTAATLCSVSQKNVRKSAGNLRGNFLQIEHLAGARRALYLQFFAVIQEELVQRADDHVIDRKPDRP